MVESLDIRHGATSTDYINIKWNISEKIKGLEGSYCVHGVMYIF